MQLHGTQYSSIERNRVDLPPSPTTNLKLFFYSSREQLA
jgi:hypothetical protein